MNLIAVVLTPEGVGSQVIVNGCDISSACAAIEIHACVGQKTEILLTLVGSVELLADVSRVIVDKESG